MTSKKKLTKKFILTADLHGKTQEDTLSKETDMVKAQIANPTLVSGLNPTATTVQGQITAITDPNTGLIHQRAVLEAQTKALTLQINKGIEDIKDIIIDQWMPQTQSALTAKPGKLSGTEDLIKKSVGRRAAYLWYQALDSNPTVFVPCNPPCSLETKVTVTGLIPNTVYHFQCVPVLPVKKPKKGGGNITTGTGSGTGTTAKVAQGIGKATQSVKVTVV